MITEIKMVKNPKNVERFNRVSCIKALRTRTGASLKSAKESMDGVMEGRTIEMHHVPMAAATSSDPGHTAFLNAAQILKANGVVIRTYQPGKSPAHRQPTETTLRTLVKKEFALGHDELARDLIDIIVKHEGVLDDEG